MNWPFQTLRCLFAGLAALVLSSWGYPSSVHAADLSPLHTAGHALLDDHGQFVRLKGVNTAGLEFTTDGQGHMLQTLNVAIHDWHANVIRLPVTQDHWFGYGPGQSDHGQKYRQLVHSLVDFCASNQCYVILDLHWSDCGQWGRDIGQHSMPDTNSVAFWRAAAREFANQPAVIFDLYNEPHDVSWQVWRHGGTITDRPNNHQQMAPPRTFEAVGMQTLLDTVRATGATNLAIIGGLDWAYDLSGILQAGPLTDPTGAGLLYANHCYDNKNQSVDTWLHNMELASARLPIIISEFGGHTVPSKVVPQDNWLARVMLAIDSHQWSWTAWDMHPSAGPTLIQDWSYTPTPKFGIYVKNALAGKPLIFPSITN